ncbi:MAG: alpha/beta hydrolase [Clostridia bacterium]|nr:alpha/beta hydrolase [Clostridia bacterium]
MDKSVYYRGKLGTVWYNFTESLAYVALHRPTPKSCAYRRIRYGNEKKQYINLCARKDLAAVRKPVFIYVHGGGWISGITEMRDTYVTEWAKRGYFTASISYTYAPDKTYPAQLFELFAALDEIYALEDAELLDLGTIVLAGESAGGYFILKLAEFAAHPELFDRYGIPFKNKDRFHVDALVSHCGCFDLKNLTDPQKPQSAFPDIKMMVSSFLGLPRGKVRAYLATEAGALASPKITRGFPPAFIISAERDALRFEAQDLAEQYKALGIPYATFEGTGIIGNHAWTIATIVKKGKSCLEASVRFVEHVTGRTPTAASL